MRLEPKWNYRIVEGVPEMPDPWEAGKIPGWIRGTREVNTMMPQCWGSAWFDPWTGTQVIMPIPFNVLGGLIWKFRRWLKWPGFIGKLIGSDIRNRGELVDRLMEKEMENRRLQYLVDSYMAILEAQARPPILTSGTSP